MAANTSGELTSLVIEPEHVVEDHGEVGDAASGSYGFVYEVKVKGVVRIAKKPHTFFLKKASKVGKASVLASFKKECVLLNKLRHPNIVKFIGVYFGEGGEDDISMVMEKVDFELASFLRESSDVQLSTKLSILQDVSYGLVYLHEYNPPIIHRDLTARNILLTKAYQAKIADVGVAKLLDQTAMKAASHTKAPGQMFYMPPEACMEKAECTFKLDIFSFGHLSLHVLLEDYPEVFEVKVTSKMLSDGTVQIMKRKSTLDRIGSSHCLYPLITQCLMDEPEKRPSTRNVNSSIADINEANSSIMEHQSHDMVSRLEEYVHKLEENSVQVSNLLAEKRDLNKTLEKCNTAILALQQESNVIIQRNQDLEARCVQLSSRNSDLVKTISNQDQKVKQLQAHIEEQSRTVAILKDDFSVERSAEFAKYQELEDERDRLKEDFQSARETMDQLRKEISSSRKQGLASLPDTQSEHSAEIAKCQEVEDALHKENRDKDSDQLRTVIEKLESSFYIICKCKPYNTTIEYLEAIASIRFYFHEVTNTFYLISEENRPVLKDTEHELIDKQQVLDPFVLYNSHGYIKIRGDIHDAKVGRQLQSLQVSIEDMNQVESTIFLLAFFKVITMSNATKTPSIDAEMGKKFDDCLRNIKLFTPEMLRISRCFLANEQGGSLFQMKITPGLSQSYQVLTLIVAHTVSVLVSRKEYSIFHPFVNMMSNAAALHGAYLPTMFDDPFDEVRKPGGNFYACPNGHRYFVGEYGRPVQDTCDVCCARIGGARHNLRSDNSVASSNDTTQRGHILGYANTRANIGAPERNLPAAAISIIRAIMHSCLMWFSCHHSECIGQLVQIVKCSVLPHNLPEFFWMHLQKDIKNLSSSIGRSIDESAVLIHLVLKRMLIENPPKDAAADNCSRLDTKIARKCWEEAYCTHYVRPELRDFNNLLSESMKEIVNDTSLEQNQLLNVVYETEAVTSDDTELHLWTYRQRVSLEHLQLTMLTSKENFPLLYEFLHMEPRLRATQYLPHIVKLQQTLYDTYNFRLDRTVAVTCTIDKFIEEIQNENSKNEYGQWITSLQKAWDLVSQELITHGQMPVPQDILPQFMSGSTSLEYLIPTTSGAGVCTTSLVDFLVLSHNDFIEMCYKAMCKKEDDRSQMQWLKNEVPITQIHSCHLLDYEDQIISVVLSHCHYSLRAGEGHTVTYDYQSLQKHILDKFVYGKPIILSDIPKVIYRNDIHTTDTFEAVQNKVKPQEQIDLQTRKEIITELHTPALLRINLDIIDTVLGFLSSAGGNPNMSLGNYIDKVLKMGKERFSRKAQEYCKLVHIISLWKILSVELAKVTWLHKQEPFDALSDLLLVPLSGEDKVALDRCLHAFDLNKLLGSLFEFLETSAGYFDENGLSWPLTMVVVEDKYENLQLPDHFKDEFPDTITVAQTAAAWKHIVDYQKENKLTNI